MMAVCYALCRTVPLTDLLQLGHTIIKKCEVDP